eukprot:jgi/Orpsp1_1/1184026/evm.model.c7180000087711.1
MLFARAIVQIKNAIDAGIELGAENYVFWGGREGYMSLLNTDQKREKEHMATMLTMARDYARSKGFKGTFLIEPKPMEPTKHQYDVDTETVIGFLKTHNLDKDFKVNIEVNHATLAGHTFEHELAVALIMVCLDLLMLIVVITKTVGILINSQLINMNLFKHGWKFSVMEDLVLVVLTLMPRLVVIQPILKIF